MGPRRTRIVRALAATVVAGAAALFGAAPATAGEDAPAIAVNYNVLGLDLTESQATALALTPELFENGSLFTDTNCSTSMPSSTTQRLECSPNELANPATYVIGVTDLDTAYYVTRVTCFTDEPMMNEALDVTEFPEASIDYSGFDVECDVRIEEKPLVYLDKVIVGDGPDGVSDFQLEIYDDTGTLVEGGIVDPAAAECADPINDSSNCAVVPLEPGTYTLGETVPSDGWAATGRTCTVIDPFAGPQREILPSPDYDFEHGAPIEANDNYPGFTHCVLSNTYTPPPTTTTTTTTTTVTPTTVAPTTVAPTTTLAQVLPETGIDSDRTSTMVLVALALLAMGGGAVLVTRRS